MSDAYDNFQEGRRRLAAGRAAQATVSLEKAKRAEPDKASIREALGIAYFRLRRWAEAEAEFRKVLELSPSDDYAHYALGRTLEKQGRAAEANGHYKLASSLRPESRRYASRVRDLQPKPATEPPPLEPGPPAAEPAAKPDPHP
jgi:Flp pilus assembly protein TadD